jgi:hypothetical protein
VELLGGDELGEAPRHAVLGGQDRVLAGLRDDPQRAAGDVGDPPAGRFGARLHDRAGRGHLPGLAGAQVGPEQPAREREHGRRPGRVERVRADAVGGQPQPFPQRHLLGRDIGLGQRPQRDRVGDQPLLARFEVEDP